jgi:hypothetical protein
MLKSFEISAQTVKASQAQVIYDPLFWKKELKLTPGQYNVIRNINAEYYTSIYQAAYRHNGNISILQSTTKELLEERSERIWNTFYPKQKRIWKKLVSSYNTGSQSTTANARPSSSSGGGAHP